VRSIPPADGAADPPEATAVDEGLLDGLLLLEQAAISSVLLRTTTSALRRCVRKVTGLLLHDAVAGQQLPAGHLPRVERAR
jgi:hypothetical protein